MALMQSTMMELGSVAPNFSLPATSGETVSLADFSNSEILVVLFICNHCPYVIHIAEALAKLADKYQSKGVAFVGINSNDAEQYPADNFESMKIERKKRNYSFPYLYDETQSVARAYNAACTPDIYVFDRNRALVYRGEFDETRPHRISSGNYDSIASPASGESLARALDLLLGGQSDLGLQRPSMGCSIKWRQDS